MIRRKVILRFTQQAVRDVLGIDGEVLAARVDHFDGGALELCVASPEAAPVEEGCEPPYARDVRDYMNARRLAGTDVFPPATADPAAEAHRPSLIEQRDRTEE